MDSCIDPCKIHAWIHASIHAWIHGWIHGWIHPKSRQNSQKLIKKFNKSLKFAKVVKIQKSHQKYCFSMIHSSILWKSTHFAAYIRKLCFWGLRNRHPYRGSEIGWPFCRENSRVKSRIFDRDGQKWGVHLCVTLHGAIENRQDPYSGHAFWGTIHKCSKHVWKTFKRV